MSGLCTAKWESDEHAPRCSGVAMDLSPMRPNGMGRASLGCSSCDLPVLWATTTTS